MIGLNGFLVLKASALTDIEKTVKFLSLYTGLNETKGSMRRGAYVRFLLIQTRKDSFLNNWIGRETLIQLFPLKILLPILVKTSFKIFFCSLITSSSAQTTPPFECLLHSPKRKCSVNILSSYAGRGSLKAFIFKNVRSWVTVDYVLSTLLLGIYFSVPIIDILF